MKAMNKTEFFDLIQRLLQSGCSGINIQADKIPAGENEIEAIKVHYKNQDGTEMEPAHAPRVKETIISSFYVCIRAAVIAKYKTWLNEALVKFTL